MNMLAGAGCKTARLLNISLLINLLAGPAGCGGQLWPPCGAIAHCSSGDKVLKYLFSEFLF